MITNNLRTIEDIVLVLFVVAIIYTDWRFHRIPNALTFPVMAIGLVCGALEAIPGGVFERETAGVRGQAAASADVLCGGN